MEEPEKTQRVLSREFFGRRESSKSITPPKKRKINMKPENEPLKGKSFEPNLHRLAAMVVFRCVYPKNKIHNTSGCMKYEKNKSLDQFMVTNCSIGGKQTDSWWFGFLMFLRGTRFESKRTGPPNHEFYIFYHSLIHEVQETCWV